METNYQAVGHPLVGWLCSYTPVEVPMAAGYLPVRLSGGEGLPRTRDPRIYHLMCPFVRAVFHEYAERAGDLPDRVVFVRCCDAMLRLHDVWRVYLDGRVDFLDLPKISSPQAVRYLAEVLEDWASSLSQGSPRRVTTDGLLSAIRGMNRARAFFRELFRSLRDPRTAVSYGWIHSKVRQWLARPTDALLSRIMSEWEESLRRDALSVGGARVVLTSTMLDQPGLIGIMEEAGLRVVAGDECLGARHFDEDVKEGGDPFISLAERYLSRWPCPRMKGSRRRLEMLDRLLEETGAEGVVMIQLKFCDQSGFEIPLIKAHLKERGVPFLVVENDYGEGDTGQIRTRIEAFAEMLRQPWG